MKCPNIHLRVLISLLCALCFCPAAVIADKTPPGAAAVTFHAADVLRAEVLTGAKYKIEETVVLRNHRYQFRIKTAWGPLSADGLNMLALRLQEMRALERAEKMSREPQFVGGLLESVGQTPRGVGALLTNPVGAVLGVPEGFKRLASTKLDPADRRAGSMTRRRIAYEIGCDPESTNPILRPLLDNLAARKGLGQFAGKIGMSAAVPGLGLVPLTAEMQNSLLVKLPHEINTEIDRELETLGAREKTRKTFLASPHFTTAQRLIFVGQLRKLKSVSGRAALLRVAARAASESDALAMNDQLRILVELHRRQTIVRVIDVGVPLAVLEDGSHVVVCSADYVLPASDVKAMLTAYRTNHPRTSAMLYCSGRVSPDAQRLFDRFDVLTANYR